MSNVVRLQEQFRHPEELRQSESNDVVRAEQASLLALTTDVLEANSLDGAVDAAVSAVLHCMSCERVAIALIDKDELRLRAVSQQATVDASSSESKLVVDAMQEACDREDIVRWPVISASKRSELGVLVAHRALAGRRRSISFCTVPLYHDQRLIGAILLQRRDGFIFTQQQGAFVEKLAVLIAPLLMLRMQTDRGILQVCRERFDSTMSNQLGTDRPGRRVLLGLTSLLLLGAFFIPVTSHIGATAELVPIERRLITAPRAGFVQSVAVVAGEQVSSGQLLATLDARELELEASRSQAEIATAEVEFRAAMASFDRQASAMARARLAQSRAQQMLVERQLEQSRLVAPIAGLVLSTDPGNSKGAPVSRGDTLFEIAPADGYEVHLLVNESDIRDIHVGQTGELSLRARPDEVLVVTVQSVHPIAESGNGSSRFRVRASLTDDAGSAATMLRPGESGQAQLDAGRKSVVQLFVSPLWQRLTELKWRLLG